MSTTESSKVLVTGGIGYIGSHTLVELLSQGKEAVILDNLSNSSTDVLRRIEMISGIKPHFIEGDVRDECLLRKIFSNNDIGAVMHFAGLKSVSESVLKPLSYYDNNVSGTTTLLKIMAETGCKNLVFSSSATVYGEPQQLPIKEDSPRSALNPYGASKLMIEDILEDLSVADPQWKIAVLRYFNPVGAHVSGFLGESPKGVPNNLMPYISEVAIGKRDQLTVFGNDYPTTDGTGVRDFIHVVDLAKGHLSALDFLNKTGRKITVNLGTGIGYSVLEVIDAYKRAAGKEIPYAFSERRLGDVASSFADPSLARRVLNWQAERDLDQMCRDAWRWQQNACGTDPN